MKYRRIGRSGVKVSVVGLGSWLTFGGYVDEAGTRDCVRRALELGVNFIDTADVYAGGEAETVLGRVLRDVPRKDVVLASKCFFPTGDGPNDGGLSRKHVFESCHASLGRLETDYLDLFQCHRFDEETPVEETVGAMSDLVRQGKILYWGVSCWTAERIALACEIADGNGGYRPISNQPPYSLLARDIEESVIPACERLGLGQVVFSPLAQGVLTGKYVGGAVAEGTRAASERYGKFMKRFFAPETIARVDRFAELARQAGTTPARLALAWCLREENVASVIVGVSGVGQLEENVAAAELEPDPAVLARASELTAGH